MPEAFDAYHKWLGIPPTEQPPNCYRLLSIALFESDPEVIASAADKQMAHIRSSSGRQSALSQRILNEIAAARICLLNAAKKAEYDEKLKGQIAALKSPPQPSGLFDPSQFGFDLAAPKHLSADKQRRQSRAKKLPWQLPAAIGAGLLASVAVIAYLIVFKSSEGDKPGMQAKAGTALHEADTGTKAKENIPSKPGPKLDAKLPKVEPKSEPEKAKPDSEPKPEPKPEVKPEPKPEPDPIEKVAERVKDAYVKAKTVPEFRTVAIDALKLIAQANSAGKQDVAKSVDTLALSAARKAKDDELAKTATLCLLEPETIHTVNDEPPIGGSASKVYLDDLEEFDVRVGHGTLGKHGHSADQGKQCRISGDVPAHSLLPHPPANGVSLVSYQLAAQFSRFHSSVAISDGQGITPLTFRVRGDGRVLWASSAITGSNLIQKCSISVEGIKVLTLEVACPGQNGSAWSVWVDPFLTRQTFHSSVSQAGIPDAAAQEKALKLVREVFKDGYSATTSEKQKSVAQELLEKAQTANNDATAQYVMLREAGRFAIRAKDSDLALQVIEEMGTRFDIDTFDLKMKALTAIGKSLRSIEPSDAIVDSLLASMKEAETKEKFDAAKQLGTTAIDVARKSRDSAFIKETAARQGTIIKEMAEIQKAQAEVLGAVDALDKNPIDPAANLVVGKFRCFLQGNWNKGISFLALGDDPALKDVALKELNRATDATELASLGDAWWDLGEKKDPLARKNIRDHGVSWYQQALPGLTGLAKDKAQMRIKNLAEPEESALPGKKPSKPGLPSDGLGMKKFNLLPRVDLQRDRVLGEWTKGNDELRIPPVSQCARVMLPVRVTGGYDLTVAFTCNGANRNTKDIAVILPVGDNRCMLYLDCDAGNKSGLAFVDGKGAGDNATTVRTSLVPFNKRCTLLVQIRLENDIARVQVSLNARRIIYWSGRPSMLSLERVWDLPGTNQPGLGTNAASVTYHSAELRVVSGEASWANQD